MRFEKEFGGLGGGSVEAWKWLGHVRHDGDAVRVVRALSRVCAGECCLVEEDECVENKVDYLGKILVAWTLNSKP